MSYEKKSPGTVTTIFRTVKYCTLGALLVLGYQFVERSSLDYKWHFEVNSGHIKSANTKQEQQAILNQASEPENNTMEEEVKEEKTIASGHISKGNDETQTNGITINHDPKKDVHDEVIPDTGFAESNNSPSQADLERVMSQIKTLQQCLIVAQSYDINPHPLCDSFIGKGKEFNPNNNQDNNQAQNKVVTPSNNQQQATNQSVKKQEEDSFWKDWDSHF